MFNVFSKKDLKIQWLSSWDILALSLVASIILLVAWSIQDMQAPLSKIQTSISLDVRDLPYFGLRSVIRMLFAFIASILATFVFGTLAAKSKRAEKILIPLIDILQSVPVLGFLEMSAWLFIALFPSTQLGLECAAIFTVFTAQVWNMILSFYQSLKTLPNNWHELAEMYQLSAWQKFWRIEVPFAMPGLLWNTMMSLSAGWFFVVASEVVTISQHEYYLPGIGSYIAIAAQKEAVTPLIYAISTMFVIILIYDQIFFRPANYWVMQVSQASSQPPPWITRFMRQSRIIQLFPSQKINQTWLSLWRHSPIHVQPKKRTSLLSSILFTLLLTMMALSALWVIYYLYLHVSMASYWLTLKLGFYTAVRVFALILVCLVVWVPIGIKIGQSPKASSYLQPIIQFLAAFPPPLLYPIFCFLVIRYQLNPDIWLSPLMILGTQWYILFNVIAGTKSIPASTQAAMQLLHLKSWHKWSKWMIPSIFPSLVTGIITASGGAWNASIEAEQVYWGNQTISAQGLGTYIKQASSRGDANDLALGIIMMCLWVFVINQIIWIPLYHMAQKRFRF